MSYTIFTHGSSGTGKSFTMHGTGGQPGLVELCADWVLTALRDHPERERLELSMSFFEIYNEKLFDLKAPPPHPKSDEAREGLKLLVDVNGQECVRGLIKVPFQSVGEFMQLYHAGCDRRATASTDVNSESSRSHACLWIEISRKSLASEASSSKRSTISHHDSAGQTVRIALFDLSGAEDLRQTGGARIDEAKSINSSLFALGNVIRAIKSKKNAKQFVNYRMSKLTRLLREALGGRNRATMLVCLSPAPAYAELVRGTLRAAADAKMITNKVDREAMAIFEAPPTPPPPSPPPLPKEEKKKEIPERTKGKTTATANALKKDLKTSASKPELISQPSKGGDASNNRSVRSVSVKVSLPGNSSVPPSRTTDKAAIPTSKIATREPSGVSIRGSSAVKQSTTLTPSLDPSVSSFESRALDLPADVTKGSSIFASQGIFEMNQGITQNSVFSSSKSNHFGNAQMPPPPPLFAASAQIKNSSAFPHVAPHFGSQPSAPPVQQQRRLSFTVQVDGCNVYIPKGDVRNSIVKLLDVNQLWSGPGFDRPNPFQNNVSLSSNVNSSQLTCATPPIIQNNNIFSQNNQTTIGATTATAQFGSSYELPTPPPSYEEDLTPNINKCYPLTIAPQRNDFFVAPSLPTSPAFISSIQEPSSTTPFNNLQARRVARKTFKQNQGESVSSLSVATSNAPANAHAAAIAAAEVVEAATETSLESRVKDLVTAVRKSIHPNMMTLHAQKASKRRRLMTKVEEDEEEEEEEETKSGRDENEQPTSVGLLKLLKSGSESDLMKLQGIGKVRATKLCQLRTANPVVSKATTAHEFLMNLKDENGRAAFGESVRSKIIAENTA